MNTITYKREVPVRWKCDIAIVGGESPESAPLTPWPRAELR